MTTETLPSVTTYMGRRIEDLSREELIDAVNLAAREIANLRIERTRMSQSIDWKKYLLNGTAQ